MMVILKNFNSKNENHITLIDSDDHIYMYVVGNIELIVYLWSRRYYLLLVLMTSLLYVSFPIGVIMNL